MQTANLEQSFQDVHGATKSLTNAYENLKRENFSEKDKKNIADFLNFSTASGLSDARVLESLFSLTVLRRQLGQCDFESVDRAKMEELVKWINKDAGYTAWTKVSKKGCLKRFYKWLRYKSTAKTYPFPPIVKWINTNVKINEMKEPDVLTDEEITKMIEAAKDNRDKALIAVAAEGGFRIAELLRIRLSDLKQVPNGVRAHVTGKTGPRTVLLITSAPILNRYLEEHPGISDPRSPLWVSVARRKNLVRVSYANTKLIIKEAAKRAGIKKRIYPHLLRHSAATRDARHNLTEPELRIKYGWTRFSNMPSLYTHLNAQAVEDKLRFIYGDGKEVKTEPEKAALLVICAKCKFNNTKGTRFCGQCGITLSKHELAQMTIRDEMQKKEAEELLARLTRAVASSDDFEKFKESVKVGFGNP